MFLDESGINTGMTRPYGRARRKDRVMDYVPDIRFQRTSVVSTVRLNGDAVPMVFNGSLNGELFRLYIKKFLTPALKEGDILILDNLSSYKSEETYKPLYDKGVTVKFLPPYSPDLNPIELMWSKDEKLLKKT